MLTNKNLLQIQRIAIDADNKRERYDKNKNSLSERDSFFLPVRHFNSDTPITPGLINNVPFNIAEKPLNINYGGMVSMKPLLIGGGYFIWHKGTGIVIDPGYEFVDILYSYHGISISDIDIIVITHDHLDHHADLETIFNLKRGNDGLIIYTNTEVIDAYGLTERQYLLGSNIQIIDISDMIGSESPTNYKDISFQFLPALHWQRLRKKYSNTYNPRILSPVEILETHLRAFGIYIKLRGSKETKILISGDTQFPVEIDGKFYAYGKNGLNKIPYFDQNRTYQLGFLPSDIAEYKNEMFNLIQKRCEKMVKIYRNLPKTDIVCLHIGSIEKGLKDAANEIDLNNAEESLNKSEICYTGFHLGLTGMLRLIMNINYEPSDGLIVVSEFGEELLGNRQNICAIFSNYFSEILKLRKINKCETDNEAISVIPSEVILRIMFEKDNILQRGVICSYCQELHEWKDISGIEGPGEMISYAAIGPNNNTHTNCTHWDYRVL